MALLSLGDKCKLISFQHAPVPSSPAPRSDISPSARGQPSRCQAERNLVITATGRTKSQALKSRRLGGGGEDPGSCKHAARPAQSLGPSIRRGTLQQQYWIIQYRQAPKQPNQAGGASAVGASTSVRIAGMLSSQHSAIFLFGTWHKQHRTSVLTRAEHRRAEAGTD